MEPAGQLELWQGGEEPSASGRKVQEVEERLLGEGQLGPGAGVVSKPPNSSGRTWCTLYVPIPAPIRALRASETR